MKSHKVNGNILKTGKIFESDRDDLLGIDQNIDRVKSYLETKRLSDSWVPGPSHVSSKSMDSNMPETISRESSLLLNTSNTIKMKAFDRRNLEIDKVKNEIDMIETKPKNVEK